MAPEPPRVVHLPEHHDYHRALYAAMPEGALRHRGAAYLNAPDGFELGRLLDGARGFHVSWPENLIHGDGLELDDYVAQHRRIVDEVRRSGVKVVWTQHDRLPRQWQKELGRAFYQMWAEVTAAAIHHTQWGMEVMCRELAFAPETLHFVIPHGHYGEQMKRTLSRAQLERELGLPPCALRIGLLGRPQKNRGIQLILDGFAACRRDDLQLLFAATTGAVPADARIVARPRPNRLLTRQEVAQQVNACDALVLAPDEEQYLTSGVVADAIGAGIPLIANRWAFFREVLGDAALYFDGSDGLTRLLNELTPEAVAAAGAATAALQAPNSWQACAEKLLGVYRALQL